MDASNPILASLRPSEALWALVRFVHLLAALFWVGGQLMLFLVVLPLLRRRGDPLLTKEVAAAAGRRFGTLTVAVLLPVLVVSGLALAWHHGVTLRSLGTTTYGMVLGIKMALVVAVFALGAAHGVVARRLTPKAGRSLAMATLVISIAIVALAALLAELP